MRLITIITILLLPLLATGETPVREDGLALDPRTERLTKLYRKFLGFEKTRAFRKFGFSIAGPYYWWVRDLNKIEAGDKDYMTRLAYTYRYYRGDSYSIAFDASQGIKPGLQRKLHEKAIISMIKDVQSAKKNK
tara:strand:+ start:78 stop:479 length:402 start_codon:yes stop_codon:yes gene_type:complete